MSLLVDSSVWIDYFNGTITPQTDFLDAALGEQEIIVGDLILAEVLQGFRQQHEFELAQTALLSFSVVPIVGQKVAIQSAKNYRFLRQNGVTIRKTIDCLIATFCIENRIQLLQADRDFNGFVQHFDLQVVGTTS
ncbi:MAG: PIN domain nuclease [Ardenticatenaceae bacterium]|nr:PIN domain nuclease [Ardenticatenaceae bacterium]